MARSQAKWSHQCAACGGVVPVEEQAGRGNMGTRTVLLALLGTAVIAGCGSPGPSGAPNTTQAPTAVRAGATGAPTVAVARPTPTASTGAPCGPATAQSN